MSGIGLSELVLLFIIGLLILGPDRLPRVASQIGRWVGRARRTANQLRYQLERELALAEQDKTKSPGPRPAVRPEVKPASPDASAAPGGEAAAPPAARSAPEAATVPAAEAAPVIGTDAAPAPDPAVGPDDKIRQA